MLAGIRLFVIPTLAVFLAGRAVRRNPSLQSKQSVAKYVRMTQTGSGPDCSLVNLLALTVLLHWQSYQAMNQL